MKISFSRTFKKQYQKLPIKLQQKFDDRIKLFEVNAFDPLLKNHALSGKYTGYYSINITGDLRALYYMRGDDLVIFGFIGTHSKLY